VDPTGSISAVSSTTSSDKPLMSPPTDQEKWWQTTMQVSVPFFLAGIGTIGAGIVLGLAEDSDVFRSIPELFILVPALMGLKGNLDMTLSAINASQSREHVFVARNLAHGDGQRCACSSASDCRLTSHLDLCCCRWNLHK